MKINELVLEQHQLDELQLKGLGTGLGKAAGTIAGGAVQGAQNFWQGAKQGYTNTRNAMRGDAPQSSNTNQAASPNLAQGLGNVANAAMGNATATPNQQPTPTQPQNTQAAPAQQPTGLGSDQFTAPEEQPAPQDAETPAQAPAKKGKVGVPAGKQAVDQAVATVQSVRSDRRPQVIQYAKQKVDALAGQAAKPAAPTQAELDADHERMASGTNEGFHSKFLGMII